jgi:hypothetical protein
MCVITLKEEEKEEKKEREYCLPSSWIDWNGIVLAGCRSKQEVDGVHMVDMLAEKKEKAQFEAQEIFWCDAQLALAKY